MISKRKLYRYIKFILGENKAKMLGANYEQPISPEQQNRNAYWTGYEHGTANVFNAIVAKFNLDASKKRHKK